MTGFGEAITETTGGRLAQVARRFAERTALIEGRRRLSFGGLDAAADAIAGSLVANGVQTGQRVALLFRNRVPSIASMFGAARAGSVYVPLDAGDPEQRLRGILEDCDPATLLTETSLAGHARVIAPHGCMVIDAAEAIEHAPLSTPPMVGANDPLYLYYTSGSTGRPKGAAQTHRNLLFFADAYARGLAITAQDRHSLVYSLSFNAANMDIYGALLAGATLVIRDLRREGLDGTAEWLDRERITVLHTVPTVFRELCMRVPHARVFPHLRVIDLGGEAVFANDVTLFRAHTAESCVLVNQLASTEVGLISQHRIGHVGRDSDAAIVPVGRCPDGVRVEIVSDAGSPAAPGETGEMVVCSEHVCPGYWRRPELDAQVFASDPASPGQRRYRSGDLGFIDADGNLTFLGRRGNRVKVRGHSVDLAEIDAALAAFPGVARGVTVLLDSGSASDAARLVACVSMQPGMRGDPQWLRRELSRSLPSYMLPGTVAFVDAMPVTASEKIDRQSVATMVLALPAVATPERVTEPPRDDCERAVAEAFHAALTAHRPQPYTGTVYMLSSRQRIGGAPSDALRRTFAGRIQRFEVGATHRDALDPSNPAFASYLTRCLGLNRGAVPASPRFVSFPPQPALRR